MVGLSLALDLSAQISFSWVYTSIFSCLLQAGNDSTNSPSLEKYLAAVQTKQLARADKAISPMIQNDLRSVSFLKLHEKKNWLWYQVYNALITVNFQGNICITSFTQ